MVREKDIIINNLYHDLSVMQTQYMDCYGDIMKLTETINCLRNSNLDLKVVNFDLKTDVEELIEKLELNKENTLVLEKNIEKVLYTNELLENDITYLKTEMTDLAKELQVLQQLLNVTNLSTDDKKLNVTKSLQTLQEHSESLVEQLKETQDQVSRQIQLNEMSTKKIEELKKLLEIKSNQLVKYEIENFDTKSKLDKSILKTIDYEQKIKSMEKLLTTHNAEQSEKVQMKDDIIIQYNSDLLCLKQKADVLNNLLTEKSDCIVKLHADLSIKSDQISKLTNENANIKKISLDEVEKLNQNILNLEEQLAILKPIYSELLDNYKKSKSDWEMERKKLNEKLENSQQEEKRLKEVIDGLKEQLETHKKSLNEKNDELKDFSSAQEEILELKDEINKVTRLRNRILCDNQKLQDKIITLNAHAQQFEDRNELISQQLDKCVQDIDMFHTTKNKLEEKNQQLENEIHTLQRTFGDLNQEIRYKNESFVNLEHELSETKSSRDEICAESRIVVSNARSWLEEQKRINMNLSNTVKEKDLLIEELSLERNLLLKNIRDVCDRYNQISQELVIFKYPQQSKSTYKRAHIVPPLKRSIYTWGSQGSMCYDSPINSPVLYEDRSYDEDSEPDVGASAKWMRKVVNLSDKLQKCNKYWKTEFGNAKKLEAVKDN